MYGIHVFFTSCLCRSAFPADQSSAQAYMHVRVAHLMFVHTMFVRGYMPHTCTTRCVCACVCGSPHGALLYATCLHNTVCVCVCVCCSPHVCVHNALDDGHRNEKAREGKVVWQQQGRVRGTCPVYTLVHFPNGQSIVQGVTRL